MAVDKQSKMFVQFGLLRLCGQALKDGGELVALAEAEHQLFESPCNLLALGDCLLKEILVELAH